MLIVMDLVLAQDPPQMVLIPDEGAVEELAAASPIQRFGGRIPMLAGCAIALSLNDSLITAA
jgi:hypothetical protein